MRANSNTPRTDTNVTRQLTDAEWALVQPRFVEAKASYYRDPRLRMIVNAVLWVSENGASWYRLPSVYPPTSTCYSAYYRWRASGVIQPILALLQIAEPIPQPAGHRRDIREGQ
jgi:transposase